MLSIVPQANGTIEFYKDGVLIERQTPQANGTVEVATFDGSPYEGSGAAGADGASAFDVAVNNGFIGTEAEWLTSLVGDDGPQGPAGSAGAAGAEFASFDHPNGGFVDTIDPSDGGMHVLSSEFQTDYPISGAAPGDNGNILEIISTVAQPHTVTGTFVGGFTTATFGGAIGDAMRVGVYGSKLYVIGRTNVVLS